MDFLDRINGFVLTVPPLREIPEELEWLWPNVLEEAAQRAGVKNNYGVLKEKQNQEFIVELRKLKCSTYCSINRFHVIVDNLFGRSILDYW